jgi:hypothetical protein
MGQTGQQPIPRSKGRLEKPKFINEVSTVCETERLITVVVRDDHLSLSWETLIQLMTSQYISLRYVLILSSNLSLGLSKCLSLSDFSIKTLLAFLFSKICSTCLISDHDYRNVLYTGKTTCEV